VAVVAGGYRISSIMANSVDGSQRRAVARRALSRLSFEMVSKKKRRGEGFVSSCGFVGEPLATGRWDLLGEQQVAR
jgi:hypothetical protein